MKGASQAAFALVGHGSDVGMKSREGFSAVQYAQKVREQYSQTLKAQYARKVKEHWDCVIS